MKLLRKAHVAAYDRVSKTGALSHIREHEDSRVRSYGRKIAGSHDSYDLHTIRRDRMGHLPHWKQLPEHTKQAILDAEEEKATQHREFEDWREKVHGDKKPDAVTLPGDKSGYKQMLMFKGRCEGMLLINSIFIKRKRESQPTDPLQTDTLLGVGLAPHASVKANISTHTISHKSKNDNKHEHLNTLRKNDTLYLLKSRKLHGRIDYQGIPVSIETGKSRIRAWHDPHNNTSGMTLMKDHYGYITNGPDGTDGDKLDAYVGPDMQAENVYIVNQMKSPDFTTFDEQKIMLGYPDEEAARKAYLRHYDKPQFLGSIDTMTLQEFKDKIASGNYNGEIVKSEQDEHSTKCSTEQAKNIGHKLNIDWNKISISEFHAGLCHEHEHDDITKGDPIKTGKIALVHLKEDPHYYTKLKRAGID